jgi:hypothetical protein
MYKNLIFGTLILITTNLFGQFNSEGNQDSCKIEHCLEPDSLFDKNFDDERLNRMLVFLPDSTIFFTSNIQNDHRFFGYAKPDTNSERLILFSVFTMDVQNNPYCCKFGAYYDLFGDSPRLKYKGKTGKFVEVELTDSTGNCQIVYFKEKWISIE